MNYLQGCQGETGVLQCYISVTETGCESGSEDEAEDEPCREDVAGRMTGARTGKGNVKR